MKKLIGFSLIVFSLILSSLGITSTADAASWYFWTEGPRWAEGASDAYIQVKSGQNIKIKIKSCNRINQNNNVSTSMKVSECGPAISAEVCNPKTGNCTARRTIGSDGVVDFTNMKGAGYEIYLYDSWPSYIFDGYMDVIIY